MPPIGPAESIPSISPRATITTISGGVGVDWTIRPTLVNQFHAGYMYQYRIFDPENLDLDNSKIVQQY